MDALQEAVMARVTRAAETREDPAVTFDQVRALANEAAGAAVARGAAAQLAPTGRARPGSPSRGSAERSRPGPVGPEREIEYSSGLIHPQEVTP